MGEIETTEQEEDILDKEGEDAAAASGANDGADDDTEEGADADDKNGDDANDKEAANDGKGTAGDKKPNKTTSKDTKGDGDEPATRKRPVDFIKQRIENRKAKQDAADDSKSDDDEDDIDPADEKTVGRIVEKYLKPLAEREAQAQDDQEIKTFLDSNPDLKPYEAKARKHMAHPSRKDVPIQDIFYAVAGPDLMKLGAKRAKIADDEARKTRSGGGVQDAGGVKSVANMSLAELEAKQAEVRAKHADR